MKIIENASKSLFDFSEFGKDSEAMAKDAANLVMALENKGYTQSSGRNRVAMISPDKRIVIKIPRNGMGFFDNGRERRTFLEKTVKKNENAIAIASCRIFFLADGKMTHDTDDSGIPLLMMKYVEPVTSSKDLPQWVDFVDCQQVGYDRDGNLVAYDL